MEIPQDLKVLYSHWDKHTLKPSLSIDIELKDEIYNQMVQLANERMQIFKKKTLGEAKPYTKDPILNTYRFCNMYRELDRQTIFFHKLLQPIKNDTNLWLLNMLFCRLICNADTVTKVGLLSFDEKHNEGVAEKLLNLSSPKYGTAYIFPISMIQKSEWDTREKFFCLYLAKKIPEIVEKLMTLKNLPVVDALSEIIPIFGFNLKFHWTETLIDFAYQYPEHIDLFGQFPIGPGSIPTMKRLNPKELPEVVCKSLSHRPPESNDFEYLTFNSKEVYLSTENWEGIGCEFRKYSNLKLGMGRKRRYS